MCRSTVENPNFIDQHRLKIKAFHLRFLIARPTRLPETLTLVYLPRINGNPLEINGAKIRADVPSFVALHRARSMERAGSEAVYASADRVRVGEAVRFEVYAGSEKAVKGVLRWGGLGWGLECRSEVDLGRLGVLGGEVSIGREGGVLMREKVEIEKWKKRRFCLKLEEIVEEKEREGCDCCCFDEEEEEEEESEEWELVDMGEEDDEEEGEGVKWAVEMGIWVMCVVGVGYLVSKASYRGLRRRRIT